MAPPPPRLVPQQTPHWRTSLLPSRLPCWPQPSGLLRLIVTRPAVVRLGVAGVDVMRMLAARMYVTRVCVVQMYLTRVGLARSV